MPRQSKSKAIIQPVAEPNQAYGQGVDAIQAQKAVPIPDQQTRLAGQLEQVAAQTPPAPASQPQMSPFDAAHQAASNMPAHPDAISQIQGYSEPVTTGVPIGPGSNQLQMQARTDADLFLTMYNLTGDPDNLLLAQRVRQQQQGFMP